MPTEQKTPEELFANLGDIFGDLFGDRPPAAQVRLPLRVSLAEAAHGAERELEHGRKIHCTTCEGRGGPPGAVKETCEACAGRGQTTVTQGMFQIATTCKDCEGTGGEWSEEACPDCHGRGARDMPGSWTVKIPPGVAAGHMLRLAGQGNDLGEGPGDLLLEIAIEPHPVLRRRGDDLVARVLLEPDLALEGGELRVPWLEGDAVVRVPPGVAHETRVVLEGWGMVRFGEAYVPPPVPDSPYRSAASKTRGDLEVTLLTRAEPARDPYEVLGVESTASNEEIQAAYRRLALAHHPDRYPHDPAAQDRFAELGKAYARLMGDEETRIARALDDGVGAPPRSPAWLLLAMVGVLVFVAYLLLTR
jgi:DnaJ-class molecular chaperone